MPTQIARRSRHVGSSRWPLLLVLLLLIGGGVLAYRYLFNRPGEAAIQLIPGDAMAVLTLDTNPSPQQVITFKQIHDAIQSEHVDTQIDDLMTGMMQNSPVAKEIRPYVSNNIAVAVLNQSQPGSSPTPDVVLLLAVTDPGKVGSILSTYGQKSTQDGLDYYQFPKQSLNAAMIANYLVFSDKPALLARIEQVHSGQTPSVATLDEYKQARAALPADANLMVFISPTALNKLQETSKATGVNPLQNARWMAIGTTVRDKGLEMVWRIPSNAAVGQSQIAPLDPAALKRLPAGAYGLVAYSQLGKYWDWITRSSGGSPDAQKMFNDGVASFEKETGLSVPQDVVPGLTGDLMLAVYPDQADPQSGVDGLIVIDDTNSADPAALADKLRAYVERASAKDGKQGVHFVSTSRDGATIWTLDDPSQEQVRHALSGMASSPSPFSPGGSAMSNPNMPSIPNSPTGTPFPGANRMGGPPPGMGNMSNLSNDPEFKKFQSDPAFKKIQADAMRSAQSHSQFSSGNIAGANSNGSGSDIVTGHVRFSADANVGLRGPNGTPTATISTQMPPANPAMDKYLKSKAVVFAQVGHAVLLASSQQMLDKALATYTSGKDSLADDPSYAQMRSVVPQGTQNLLLVNLPGIMQALRPMLAKSLSGSSGMTPDDITSLFGSGNDGIVGSQQYDGKVATMTFFMPLDYARLIHLIGKSTGGPTPPTSVPHP